jgi:hypothetical protein
MHNRSCRVPIESWGDDRAKKGSNREVLLLFAVYHGGSTISRGSAVRDMRDGWWAALLHMVEPDLDTGSDSISWRSASLGTVPKHFYRT